MCEYMYLQGDSQSMLGHWTPVRAHVLSTAEILPEIRSENKNALL